MNTQSVDALITEIDIRNEKIHELKVTIEKLYMAAEPLIQLAKNSGECGQKVLNEWDKNRP